MAIVNGYATLSEVKAALRIDDTVDDELLEIAIETASRAIDGYCERSFYSAGTATRLFIPQDAFRVEIDDLQSLTTLRTSSDGDNFSTTWQADDYQLEPLNGISGGIAFPTTRIIARGSYLFPIWDPKNPNHYEATVQVTGVWGWAAIPTAIKQACILSAARQFKRYDAPLGVLGMSDLGAIRVGRIDPDVEALVAPFKKVSFA